MVGPVLAVHLSTLEPTQAVCYACVGSCHYAVGALSYSKLDPYEATIVIVHDNTLTPVVWGIARDLFSEAIRGKRPDKGADVQVSSDSNRVFMKLCPPGSRPVTFHFYVEDISRFLS